MIVSEWFGWECILFVAGGLCTKGEEQCAVVEAMPLCTTVMVCEFLLTFGLGQATSNRVGNLLGAGKGGAAAFCAQVPPLALKPHGRRSAACGTFRPSCYCAPLTARD